MLSNKRRSFAASSLAGFKRSSDSVEAIQLSCRSPSPSVALYMLNCHHLRDAATVRGLRGMAACNDRCT